LTEKSYSVRFTLMCHSHSPLGADAYAGVAAQRPGMVQSWIFVLPNRRSWWASAIPPEPGLRHPAAQSTNRVLPFLPQLVVAIFFNDDALPSLTKGFCNSDSPLPFLHTAALGRIGLSSVQPGEALDVRVAPG
jgi:hypothetical protein